MNLLVHIAAIAFVLTSYLAYWMGALGGRSTSIRRGCVVMMLLGALTMICLLSDWNWK